MIKLLFHHFLRAPRSLLAPPDDVCLAPSGSLDATSVERVVFQQAVRRNRLVGFHPLNTRFHRRRIAAKAASVA